MRADDFTIAWVCALPLELAASRAMFDEVFPAPTGYPGDENVYYAGRIGPHNIIMTSLPPGQIGGVAAVYATRDMRHSFHSIRLCVMVGIGAGVPGTPEQIQLGDVIVSKSSSNHCGVIEYDLSNVRKDGSPRIDFFFPLSHQMLAFLTNFGATQTRHSSQYGQRLQHHMSSVYNRFPAMRAPYSWPASTAPSPPRVHHGLIASGNKVIAYAPARDRYRTDDAILCFEMEAAALSISFPFLVIRGVSDFADGNKNDQWQNYAALAAASHTKELLRQLPESIVQNMPSTAQRTRKPSRRIGLPDSH